ncbi:MAG TPA: MmgE/PrpD family protein [Kofleriaceae bacterium]|nr:MmgE/PrpD family protein [Kofleriaceae bacterium]
MNDDTRGYLSEMGAWLAGQHWSTIPEPARHAARVQMLNMVAAAHATARSHAVLAMLDALPASDGPSTVIATGRRVAPAEAAFVNAAFSMAQDFDDIIWIGHTCHSAVFAALAVAEAEHKSSRDMIAAIVLANEIAGRIGGSTFFGPLNGQMWTFIHLVGAAAAAAHLLGLDAAQSTHALAIALAQPPLALQPAFFEPTSKFLAAAVPTQIGVQAAYFARAGMTGATRILEDRKGFWKWFAFIPLPGVLKDLGKWWAMQTLAIKSYPACNYFQTACSAIELACADRWPAQPEAVEQITIYTTKLGIEATRFAREYAPTEGPLLTHLGVGFDVALAAAVLLHARRLTGEECETQWLEAHADPLRRWYGRIKVVHDPALTLRVFDAAWRIEAGREAIRALRPRDLLHIVSQYRAHYGSSLFSVDDLASWVRTGLARLRAPRREAVGDGATTDGYLPIFFPNRVELRLADGTILREQVDLQPGSLASPAAASVLETKFVREVAARLGADRARAALTAGLALDGESIASFVARVTPAH